jgi:toxin ParE1/3/4
MKHQLILRNKAEKQIQEAFEQYRKKHPVPGNDFLETIECALEFIRFNPFAYPLNDHHLRMKTITRFPYGIFYLVSSGKIIVLAVLQIRRSSMFHTEPN